MHESRHSARLHRFFLRSQVRPIALVDFEEALTQVRASVSQADLRQYVDWNEKFGSFKRIQ